MAITTTFTGSSGGLGNLGNLAPTASAPPTRANPNPAHHPARRTVRACDPAASDGLRRLQQRDRIDQLLDRASCLLPADLALLRAAYADGRSLQELSLLLGIGPRSIRRRLKRLTDRLSSPRFLYIVRCSPSWPRTRQRIATAIFLHGRPLRAAARGSSASAAMKWTSLIPKCGMPRNSPPARSSADRSWSAAASSASARCRTPTA